MVLIYLHALTMIASVWSDRQRTDERPYSGHFSPTFLINFLTFYINIRNVNYSLKTQCLRCRGLGWWDSVTRSNTHHVVRYRFQSFKPRHPKFTVYDHRERKIIKRKLKTRERRRLLIIDLQSRFTDVTDYKIENCQQYN